ncbi:carotenoid oxygenase family protein [Mesorhizobium sp.]|uniref:carotenoid oxygenase family protein n=1 Tax=Mesorhizobium sp. TaxID=1871066 RepID=UPI000FE36E51|nr:carotenoid oxygenase family protein [Mesorhizobium sp.]RWN59082.1 MAG: carotenoid oxygenase family protein [Mesorhizobium sp.]RWN63848.1 MAG: carotenoid oxygenase family protein [Mesorhizobium sp.]RWN80589.1 MAG: carotenoid oxygenase family protein [Mesorhizobium sp.]RWN83626.1 MAG: carotenoid oxygenase family protein [Mesorhizobium sp.]RWN87625.1 MAG: carotenoid oxygenase family protein [Mesorhizobium sp.]
MPEANGRYALGFTTLEHEVDRLPLKVNGALPAWLTGRLIRTGPAKFEVGRQAYTHWFDGLAMLHAFDFRDGTVRYSNRFIRSQSYCEAMKKGRIARGEFMTDPCRTIFGRVMAIFKPKLTDNANVNVSLLAGEIVALTETPMPIHFDPATLETQGRLQFSQAIKGQISTAHPHSDGERGYSYVIEMGRRSTYRLFVDERGAQRVLAELPVDRPSYMHSFGMSERYLVLTEFPLRVNPLKLAFSGKPFITNYRWQPEFGTLFTVIDKSTGAVVARARAAPCFCFHHVNAFEADGALLVDLLAYPDAKIIDDLRLDRLRIGAQINPTSILTRYRIPLDGNPSAAIEIEPEPLCDTRIELPRIDYSRRAGRAYRCVWGTGQSEADSFLDTIAKIELSATAPATVTTWTESGCYPGEPVFVARPAGGEEDDGVLLSVVLDAGAGTSFLLVLDAATLAELARASVPHHVPFGFHGNYFAPLDRPAH